MNRSIEGFALILDEGYLCTSNVFSNAAENEFRIITESNMSDSALITRVKNTYKDRIEDFTNATGFNGKLRPYSQYKRAFYLCMG